MVRVKSLLLILVVSCVSLQAKTKVVKSKSKVIEKVVKKKNKPAKKQCCVSKKSSEKKTEPTKDEMIDPDKRYGVKAYEFFPGLFPQAKKLLRREFSLKNYFRRFSLFREFSTLAVFDVVPVCGNFFKHYHTLRLADLGYDMKQARKYLLELKKELTALTMLEVDIFVFTDLKAGNEVGLEVNSSPWRFSLKVGDEQISPRVIEPVSKDRALEEALNPWFDRFKLKKCYKLTFLLPKNFVAQDFLDKKNIEKEACNICPSAPKINCELSATYLSFQASTDLPKIEGYKAGVKV